ncbi:MAG TPA: amidohydrolase [Terriglobales bacterium]|nr:amidohydrolase [Terriglobales bacterium]
MKASRVAVMLVLSLLSLVPFASAVDIKKKEEAVSRVKARQADLVSMSDQIWAFAETALREKKSAKLLADYAEQQGFKVERGVAGMPTAFVASYGEGRPIIGILGEYDALPGISQKASPVKEPLVEGAAGHGCGHNLFGSASMGAALAIKEMIAAGKLKGTIRFYGTPAEESVGGKVYMARAGLFNDLDVALAWHPADETEADTDSSQAIIDFIVEFKGKAAHAAFDPWNGRSAVDGMELFTDGLNMMREHIRPTSRIHYTLIKGGDVPNVIPEYAKVWVWVRDNKRENMDEMMQRVRKMAQGAALMADVESKLTVQAGDYEMLVNMAGERALYNNLVWLGPLEFTEEEQEFARKIQKAAGVEPKGLKSAITPIKDAPGEPEGGSTDVGDVSWLVPTLHLSVTTAPEDAPWHGWSVVATGGMSIGHKGMMYASQALAATMVDLFEDAELRKAIRAEFEEKTKGFVYKPYVPEGPPPLPAD